MAGLEQHITTEADAVDLIRSHAFNFSPDLVRILQRPTRRAYAPEDLDDARFLEMQLDDLRAAFMSTVNYQRMVSCIKQLLAIDAALSIRAIGLQ